MTLIRLRIVRARLSSSAPPPRPCAARRRRSAIPDWIATTPPDLTDAEAAAFGRTHLRREAETFLAFLRAGGGAILHR